MEKYKQEFIEFMVDCGVLKFGDFVTKSGRKTPFFVNTGFYRTGAQLRKLGEYYAKAINDTFGTDFDVLFGPAYKGIPLTVATSMAISEHFGADIKYCSNRKEVKDHGDKGILLGRAIVTMKEVVEHLYNKEYKGKVIIDDTLKAAIDAYYEQYGVK